MGKILSIYTIISILFLFFIKEAKSFEEEIINKYGAIKTKYSSMIINTTEFIEGDDIYIVLDSESQCDDYLRYQFYDKLNDIYSQKSDLKYNIRAKSYAVTHILGKKTHLSLYYAINKNKNVLGNLEGKILYIEFKCEGEVEIKNTKSDSSNKFIYIGIFIVIAFLIIFCFLLIQRCLFCVFCLQYLFKKDYQNRGFNLNNIQNPQIVNNPQFFMNYPQDRYIYISQNQNGIQINNPNNNINYAQIPEYPPQQNSNHNTTSFDTVK